MTSEADDLPLVSICMAVYNGGAMLQRALDSAAAQDYPNTEIIICDDGSSDGSREVSREFAARYPHCTLVENPQRLGLVGNYNKLIGLARGKFLLWADQDDYRDPAYVRVCVDILESQSEAVLCHSHTGVIWPDASGDLYHINTLDSVDDVGWVVARYWRFLRNYSDTTIYGLIRRDALVSTSGWQSGLGSANRLLFELLLQGRFRQVPEVLYWYTAKGAANRPNPAEEYERQNAGRQMPGWYRPFLAVAWSQASAIRRSRLSRSDRALLFAALLVNLLIVNAAKLTLRVLRNVSRPLERRLRPLVVPVVFPARDIRFTIEPSAAPTYYGPDWPLPTREGP